MSAPAAPGNPLLVPWFRHGPVCAPFRLASPCLSGCKSRLGHSACPVGSSSGPKWPASGRTVRGLQRLRQHPEQVEPAAEDRAGLVLRGQFARRRLSTIDPKGDHHQDILNETWSLTIRSHPVGLLAFDQLGGAHIRVVPGWSTEREGRSCWRRVLGRSPESTGGLRSRALTNPCDNRRGQVARANHGWDRSSCAGLQHAASSASP